MKQSKFEISKQYTSLPDINAWIFFSTGFLNDGSAVYSSSGSVVKLRPGGNPIKEILSDKDYKLVLNSSMVH